MPEIFYKDPSKVAVALHELVPDFFPSYGALKLRMWRDAKASGGRYGIKRLQRAGNTNEVLFDFDTLPREIQLALGDIRDANHYMERFYDWDAEAYRYYNMTFQFDNGQRLSDEHVERFTLNASVLMAVREYRLAHEAELAKHGRKAKYIYMWMANECVSFQKSLKIKHKLQHSLPPSERQFRNVYDSFFVEEGTLNYKSLIDGRLQNDNALVLTDALKALLDSLFARSKGKPSKKKVADMYASFQSGETLVINNDTGEQYDPQYFEALSDKTITAYLNTYVSRAGTLSLRSADRQKLNEVIKPKRAMELPEFAGSVFSIDDRQPPFEYDAGKRLWIYNGLDVASQAVVSSVFGKTKDGIIIEFYRQCLRNHVQWGFKLPYQLEAEVSLNKSFENTFLKNGAMFQKVSLIPNNARTKYIERMNGELRYRFEKDLPNWKGRPFALDESNQPMPQDNIYRTAKYTPYDLLLQQSRRIIEDWNNSEHPRFPGLTRWDYFVSRQHKDLVDINWRGVLPHLGHSTKSSCNLGAVQLQGFARWIALDDKILTGDDLIRVLLQVEGQDVTVYWLDGNNRDVMKAMVYMGDHYICDLLPIPKYHRSVLEQTPQCIVNKLIQDKYVGTVEAFIKRRGREIDRITVIEPERTLNSNFAMPDYAPQDAIRDRTFTEDDMYNPEIIEFKGDDDDDDDIDITPKRSALQRF